jgi:imidazolonepropionase-like amidohydrolase/ABC-type multidrug transport system permease subunit
MKAYVAMIRNDIRLAFRQRVVIFFNYFMPFLFFFIFAQAFHAEQGSVILQVVTMVTVIGILGNGLMGAGLRAAQERENNVLRRFKVTPISPLPIMVSSMVTGLVVYMPFVIGMLFIARARYGMVMPANVLSVLVFVVLGIVAMRTLGLMVASVANSMQESNIIVQVLYMAMLFLSGASFPLTLFPHWLLNVTQFIPATYLVSGMEAMMMRGESLWTNWQAVVALLLTAVIGSLLCVKLFRWEKDEKMRPSAKLWLLAVLAPFFIIGAWQAHAQENVRKQKILTRDMDRSRTLLVRNARIIIGNGAVIENGGILIRNGKVAQVYTGNIPDPKQVKADPIDAAGKTVLPGLIDVHVHLGAPGGIVTDYKNYDPDKAMPRELAAYLYSGVTAVKSVGDMLDAALKTREIVNSGEKLGAQFFLCGPLFTAPGGHGTEYFDQIPEPMKSQMNRQFTRLPNSPSEAKQMVDALKKAGVDGIKAILDAGAGSAHFNRLDPKLLDAIAAEARADGLPVVVHTGSAQDVADALAAKVDGIEHGSFQQRIPDADFTRMAANGVTYDPTLSVAQAQIDLEAGKLDALDRSLVQQAVPPSLLRDTRKFFTSPAGQKQEQHMKGYPIDMAVARDNLLRAWKAGVTLVTGSDAGNPLVFHGPTVQRELELWVQAGIPAAVALRAGTLNAAKLLRRDAEFGSIQAGKDANLLIVNGNPLEDIRATENISNVIFRGEMINRSGLLKQEE